MKLIWHIIKKDFSRLRLPLLLWTFLLLGKGFLNERLLSVHSFEPGWFNLHGNVLVLLSLVNGVICYILVASLVREDATVGTRTFWMTRPISGSRLLTAKLLGMAVMLGLWPVLVALPSWLAGGFGLRDLAVAAYQTICVQSVIVIPAFMLAVLTAEVSQFIVWTIVLFIAVAAIPGVIVLNPNHPDAAMRELFSTRGYLSSALGMATVALVVCLQYRTRRTVQSIVIGGIGIGSALLIATFWPWNLISVGTTEEASSPESESIAADFSTVTVHTVNGRSWLSLGIAFKGVPADVALLSGYMDVELRWPDGGSQKTRAVLQNDGSNFSPSKLLDLPPSQPDPASERKTRETHEAFISPPLFRGDAGSRPLEKGIRLMVSSVGVEPPLAGKLATVPIACTASLRVTTSRPHVLLELPLKAGATSIGNSLRMLVIKIYEKAKMLEHPGDQKQVTVVYSNPRDMPRPNFYLVDRNHGSAILLDYEFNVENFTSLLPLKVTLHTMSLPVPQLWRNDQWTNSPAWLEADTLAAVVMRPNGQFRRELKTDKLDIADRIGH